MFAIDGYSHKEISEKLGIQEGSSRSQLAKARQSLMMSLNALNKYKKTEL
jgi:RNA polymerase sigma-70 factor (ECF subfamily)